MGANVTVLRCRCLDSEHPAVAAAAAVEDLCKGLLGMGLVFVSRRMENVCFGLLEVRDCSGKFRLQTDSRIMIILVS